MGCESKYRSLHWLFSTSAQSTVIKLKQSKQRYTVMDHQVSWGRKSLDEESWVCPNCMWLHTHTLNCPNWTDWVAPLSPGVTVGVEDPLGIRDSLHASVRWIWDWKAAVTVWRQSAEHGQRS